MCEMENALPVFLEELLSAKRRRKDLHKTLQETEIDSRKFQEKHRKRQSRQVQDLHRKFPSLQKTLQEINDFDLTLPTELFPARDPAPIPTPSNQTPFHWTTYKARGLEDVFLKKEVVVESGRKRKRQMAAPPGEAEDEGKRSRHLVIVNFEKCKSHVPSPLRHFHSAAVEASERIQSVEKARVALLAKKTRTRFRLTKTEFYVSIEAPGKLGFLVGLDSISGMLYIKDFPKEAEMRTREALCSVDPTDPGIGPRSFSKKGKLCFQWLQRLVSNEGGRVYFTATDLYKRTEQITMDSVYHTFSQFRTQ